MLVLYIFPQCYKYYNRNCKIKKTDEISDNERPCQLNDLYHSLTWCAIAI